MDELEKRNIEEPSPVDGSPMDAETPNPDVRQAPDNGEDSAKESSPIREGRPDGKEGRTDREDSKPFRETGRPGRKAGQSGSRAARKSPGLLSGALSKILLAAVAVLAVIFAGGFLWKKIDPGRLFGRKTRISDITILDVSPTEKLKTLTMYKEVMMSFHKPSDELFSLSDDMICAIYPARLDFGFDLSGCDSSWLSAKGDTLLVKMPPVRVLNKDGASVDEARKRVPIERGVWSVEDNRALSSLAGASMLRSCERDDCYREAEKQGRIYLENLFHSFGFENVLVEIEPRRSYGLYNVEDEVVRQNSYSIERGDKLLTFSYDGGGKLYLSGDFTPEQTLSMADFYGVIRKAMSYRPVHVHLDGNTLFFSIINTSIVAGSRVAESLAKEIDPGAYKGLFSIIRKGIVGEDVTIIGRELDKYRQEFYRYN